MTKEKIYMKHYIMRKMKRINKLKYNNLSKKQKYNKKIKNF